MVMADREEVERTPVISCALLSVGRGEMRAVRWRSVDEDVGWRTGQRNVNASSLTQAGCLSLPFPHRTRNPRKSCSHSTMPMSRKKTNRYKDGKESKWQSLLLQGWIAMDEEGETRD